MRESGIGCVGISGLGLQCEDCLLKERPNQSRQVNLSEINKPVGDNIRVSEVMIGTENVWQSQGLSGWWRV